MPKRQKRYLIQNNGQITLPQQLREKFSLEAGDEVVFESTSSGILVRPVNPPKVWENAIGVREDSPGYKTK